jgi:glycerol-3-phosphate dehydrogenase (NAD(P)+)
MGYKENAKAGLLTQGLQEIMVLSQAMGGEFKTLFDSSVLGDLALTCYSKTSRNTKFGYEFALSENHAEFLLNYPHLIEGRESVNLILELAKKYQIDLPIISSVAQALKS